MVVAVLVRSWILNRTVFAAIALAAVISGFPAPAVSQSGASLSASTDPFHRHRPLVPGDSLEVLRAVRSRQFAFERFRRSNFEQAPALRRVDCDEVIGRFCYIHSETDSVMNAEPAPVAAARASLIAALDTAVQWQPGDPWIVAQLVRYLTESGEHDDALAAAEACQLAEDWLCYAFAGYVRHWQGRYVLAGELFDEALGAMPEETRCEWTDVTVLLPGRLRRTYEDTPCEERTDLNERLWWLADPLYLMPGNDRRTEHIARQVLNKILERSESGYGVYWSTDLGKLVTRFGWPAGWKMVMVGRNETWMESAVVSRHPFNAKTFVPNSRILESPLEARAFEWSLDDPDVRSRYAPPYARSFEYLESYQAVPFLRGDSAIVVAAFRLRAGFAATETPVQSALSMSANEAISSIATGSSTAATHRLTVTGAAVPSLLSIEALDTATSTASRVRYGIVPPALVENQLTLSDILLFEPIDPLPTNLADVARLAQPGSEFAGGDRIGLYWEIYGLAESADSVVTSVTLLRGGRSFLGGIARAIGVGGSERPAIAIDWTEPSGISAFAVPRSVSIELGDLRPGNYTLRVSVESAAGRHAASQRTIQIIESGLTPHGS